jgi:transmembrane sensor
MNYPTARDEQAAYWHLKLQEPDVSAEEIQAALEWQADPQNRAAIDRVAAFWNAWPGGAGAREPELRVAPVSRRGLRAWPWRIAAAAGVAAVILAAGALLFPARDAAPISVHEYATPVGQIDSVTLPDGTRVLLGGATSIHVRYADDIRHVQFSSGEALFEVTKDARRPFVVEMPNGSVRVLGTQFNVHRGPDAATVTVLEGTVRVTPPEWRAGGPVELASRQQLSLGADGRLGPVSTVNEADVGSWRSGRLIFTEQSLRSVVADLNRYSPKPVLIGDPSLADIRISGTAKVEQVDAWLDALGTMLDVRVVRDDHGVTLDSASR